MNIRLSLNCDFYDLFDEDDEEREYGISSLYSATSVVIR